MEKNVLVSVIMPVYNVEKYIKRAVNSVRAYEFSDFEIILSDDGSTDNSGKICDELSREDERIITIHKKNGGVSSARNEALKIAKGKYIYFMDPDDYLTADFSENIEIAEKYNCDQVVFSFESEICDNDDNVINHIKYHHNLTGLLSFDEFKKNFISHLTNVHHVVWNRIYKKSSIEGVPFSEEVSTAEDAIFNIELLKKGFGKIYYNDKIYYSYMCRNNSLMNKYNPRRLENELIINDRLKELVKDWGMEEAFKKPLSLRCIESVLTEYSNVIRNDCPLSLTEISQKFNEYYNDHRVKSAKEVISVKDMGHITFKITYFLSDKKMFKTAALFRKAYTVLSQTAHRVLHFLIQTGGKKNAGKNQHNSSSL